MSIPFAEIYTDGACSGNPGPGGWAAVIIMDGQETELAGGEAHTTNQRMELKAAVEGLQHLSNPARSGFTATVPTWSTPFARGGWSAGATTAG